MKAVGWKRGENDLVGRTLAEAMRSYGREPALAPGHRPPHQPSQQGMAAALLGNVAVVQHQGGAGVGLVAVVHVRRDELQPTEGRL
eukprot:6135752-Alexandrium_andersonii.AAC.1